MTEEQDSTVAAIAAKLGLTTDDECTPDGIEWDGAGPAEGAPVFLVPGWSADDGNQSVAYPSADTGREAAEEYVSGSWGESDRTSWVHVSAWQVCVSIDEDGKPVYGRYAEDSYTIAIEPEEPDCEEGHDHDWRSPYSLLGGLEENPGVWGHGGGVVYHEVCVTRPHSCRPRHR